MRRPLYLDHIAYCVGEARPIASIEPIAQDEGLLSMLTALGMDQYRHSTRSPTEMATDCVRETLESAKLAPAEVDALVYTSSSFWNRDFYGLDIGKMCRNIGLERVTPVGVFLAECGNLVSALRVARGLLSEDGCRHVLVVSADACQDPQQRLVPPAVSVLSDGAASCIMGRRESSLELLGIEQRSDQRIREVDNSKQFVKTMSLTATGVQSAAAALLRGLELDAAQQIAQLIMNNYTPSVARVFATQCGVPLSRVYSETRARFGHVFAADLLINLKHYQAERAESGTLALALGTGVCTWGLAALRFA